MRADPLLRFLFVVYCVEAGVVFLLAPWTPSWDRWFVQSPWRELRALGAHPAFRGAISGFGLVHLVWALHDASLWISRGHPKP